MRNCLRARRRLWAYLERPDREPEVGEHLRRCPTCAAAAARMEREGAALRDATSLPPLPDADQMWAAIAPQVPRRRPVLLTALIPLAPAALAALLWLAPRTTGPGTRDQGPGTMSKAERGRVGEGESGRVGDGETGGVGDGEMGGVGEWESGRVGDGEMGGVAVAAGSRRMDVPPKHAVPRPQPAVESRTREGHRAPAVARHPQPVRVVRAEHAPSHGGTMHMRKAPPISPSPTLPVSLSPTLPRAAPLRLTEPEPGAPGAPVAAVFVLHAPAQPPHTPVVLGGAGGAEPAVAALILPVTHTFCRSEVTDPDTGSTSRLAVTREVDADGAARRVTIEYVVGPPNREGTGRET